MNYQRIAVDGTSYEVRWPFRKHKPDERARIVQSLQQDGLFEDRLPIRASVEGQSVIVDGLHRITYCLELGIPVRFRDLGTITQAEGAKLSVFYNENGRLWEPEEWEAARAKRLAEALDLSNGKKLSLRAIGARLGVSHTTAAKYLQQSGSGSTVTPLTLEPNEDRPTTCLPAGVHIEPPDPPGERYSVGTDGHPRRIAPAARPTPASVGKAEIDKLTRTIGDVMDALEAVLDGPGGSRFRKEATRQNLILTPDGPYCPALLLLRDVAEAVAR